MKHLVAAASSIVIVALAISNGLAQDLPTIDGKRAVASVNDEPITLDELKRQSGSSAKPDTDRQKELELISRLINIKLMVQEGRRMGLDELPEIRSQIDANSKSTLRQLLMEMHVRDLQPDEKEVEQLYKDSVREWKTSSLLFEKEDAAKAAEDELKKGANFDELASRLIANGSAKSEAAENYNKTKDLLPQIAVALSHMKVGSVSPVIPINAGFVLMKLVDVRHGDRPEAKEEARQMVLQKKQQAALQDYEKELSKKYVVFNQANLDKLDYEAKEPGFQALLKDQTVLAEIKGEEPITVAEMTDYLRKQFFHGAEQAAQSKRLNSKKLPVLDEMVRKRIFRKEALALGIDKTAEYESRTNEFAESIIFETFVQKAIVPDVKLKEEELKSYFNEHLKDFSYPQMMRIRSLAFVQRPSAEAVLEKLRTGTDFNWLAANAEGQVDKGSQEVSFTGELVTVDSLPEGVDKAVSGAKAGDFRLYVSSKGQFFVLFIQDMVPSSVRPYEETRQEIAKRLFESKLKKAVDDWADKLKALSDVKIYLIQN